MVYVIAYIIKKSVDDNGAFIIIQHAKGQQDRSRITGTVLWLIALQQFSMHTILSLGAQIPLSQAATHRIGLLTVDEHGSKIDKWQSKTLFLTIFYLRQYY